MSIEYWQYWLAHIACERISSHFSTRLWCVPNFYSSVPRSITNMNNSNNKILEMEILNFICTQLPSTHFLWPGSQALWNRIRGRYFQRFFYSLAQKLLFSETHLFPSIIFISIFPYFCNHISRVLSLFILFSISYYDIINRPIHSGIKDSKLQFLRFRLSCRWNQRHWFYLFVLNEHFW